MATPQLDPAIILPPSQSGYQYKPGAQILVEQLEGGAPRTRRDQLGANHYVTCKWQLTTSQYQHIMGFFREQLNGFADPFRLQLVIDVPFLVPYVCRLLEEPVTQDIEGLKYEVTAKLSVTPNPIRSFSVRFSNTAAIPEFVDTGSAQYAGNLSEFPNGRGVRIVGSRQLVNGVDINLDGTYTITGTPSVLVRQMSGAAAINPAWNTLGATVAQQTANGQGAVILLPL